MKTFSKKPADVTRKWYLVDASELPLGRLSTKVANILMGKNKVDFTPHVDGGDYVVVINSDSLKVTGDKLEKKVYYRHSGFPGGIKQATLREKMEKDSTDVVVNAVRGMIPANKLRPDRLARLKVFKDGQHSHTAQQPVKLELTEGKK